jgi:hypothetical protein
MTFVVLGAISAAIYFVFLCYMVWKVFRNISIKRSVLPSMSKMRRLHYEGIIYRFKFLMLATLLCAFLNTGVYGMWNIYILALIILYSPSHKQWPQNETQESIISEEIEFNNLPSDSNPTEISSLTQFARKTALD